MKRKIIGILVLTSLIFLNSCSKIPDQSELKTGENTGITSLTKNCTDSTQPKEVNQNVKVGWKFEHYSAIGSSDEEILKTDIYLLVTTDKLTEFKLGSYDGKAKEIAKEDYEKNNIPSNALNACLSWYAGSGDYFYITTNKSSLSVMWRNIDASGGEGETIEIPEYQEIKQINIPDASKIGVSPTVDIIK